MSAEPTSWKVSPHVTITQIRDEYRVNMRFRLGTEGQSHVQRERTADYSYICKTFDEAVLLAEKKAKLIKKHQKLIGELGVR